MCRLPDLAAGLCSLAHHDKICSSNLQVVREHYLRDDIWSVGKPWDPFKPWAACSTGNKMPSYACA